MTDSILNELNAALVSLNKVDRVFASGKWDESKHPRDHGKFAEKAGKDAHAATKQAHKTPGGHVAAAKAHAVAAKAYSKLGNTKRSLEHWNMVDSHKDTHGRNTQREKHTKAEALELKKKVRSGLRNSNAGLDDMEGMSENYIIRHADPETKAVLDAASSIIHNVIPPYDTKAKGHGSPEEWVATHHEMVKKIIGNSTQLSSTAKKLLMRKARVHIGDLVDGGVHSGVWGNPRDLEPKSARATGKKKTGEEASRNARDASEDAGYLSGLADYHGKAEHHTEAAAEHRKAAEKHLEASKSNRANRDKHEQSAEYHQNQADIHSRKARQKTRPS